MATVILVRHGRTTANATGVLAGRTAGVLLDETGRDQAAATGERLAVVPLVGVVSSPLERCRETAQRIIDRQPGSNTVAVVDSIMALLPEVRAQLPGGLNLDVLIDSSARESGLGKSLSSSQPTGDKGLRIRLDKAPFDALVAWLARLSQQHGVRVESAEIEAAGEVGLVNAGLVLKAG